MMEKELHLWETHNTGDDTQQQLHPRGSVHGLQ